MLASSPAAQLKAQYDHPGDAALAEFLGAAAMAGLDFKVTGRRAAKPAPSCAFCGKPVTHAGLVLGAFGAKRNERLVAVRCAACLLDVEVSRARAARRRADAAKPSPGARSRRRRAR